MAVDLEELSLSLSRSSPKTLASSFISARIPTTPGFFPFFLQQDTRPKTLCDQFHRALAGFRYATQRRVVDLG